MDLDQILAVTLSGVRPEEAPAVKRLVADCDLPTADLTDEKLRHFLVARKGDVVVGTVGVELFPPQALLRSLAVEEAYRGQGIASKLLQAVERYARMMGATQLVLLTLTAEDYFSRYRYSTIKRSDAPASLEATEEFKTLCPDTAVCMRKQIA